jgi:hypothetical protein
MLQESKQLKSRWPIREDCSLKVGLYRSDESLSKLNKSLYLIDSVGECAEWAANSPRYASGLLLTSFSAAAKDADVNIAVLGITGDLEGEEVPVNDDGFKGGDRVSIDLPKPEVT